MQSHPKNEVPPENLPGILVIGSSGVGKRTLLSHKHNETTFECNLTVFKDSPDSSCQSKEIHLPMLNPVLGLLSVDFEDSPDSSSDIWVHGWSIYTKYYTADVSVWMAHLGDDSEMQSLPLNKLAALVMVFDINEPSSLTSLRKWVSRNDVKDFDVLLCIGNKVDLVPGHPVHAEYRRRIQKIGDEGIDYYAELDDCGISEIEGSSLLGNDGSVLEIRDSCLEWCLDHNIEYIEACASSQDFDKCLSVNGDSQGLERLFGALSAHMWPGMVLKSGDKINEPSLPETEEISEEESDYELKYEILSAGSAEPWDDTEDGWVSAGVEAASHVGGSSSNISGGENKDKQKQGSNAACPPASTVETSTMEDNDGFELTAPEGADSSEANEDRELDFEDLEQLMFEIGNMRNSLRLMPDFQRREMAAKLALKMAFMFGGTSDGED